MFKKKDVDQIYDIFVNNTKLFTEQELIDTIVSQGYSKSTAKALVERYKKAGLSFKQKGISQVSDKQKQEALQQLQKQVKLSKKEEVSKTKDLQKINNPSFFKKIGNSFQKFYFSLEDKYYNFIEKIHLQKTTDSIDKVFPSFILFIIIIIGLIGGLYFLFSGIFIGSKLNLIVQVVDPANVGVSDANVSLYLNDLFVGNQQTDPWGSATFENVKKGSAKLVVSKELYNPKTYSFELNKNTLLQNIVLDININYASFAETEEKTRDIYFVTNDLLVLEKLYVNFFCSVTSKTPAPSSVEVTTGKIMVTQPKGCGNLQVSVSSEMYENIQQMVVPENNKVSLTKKASATGTLSIHVNDLNGNSVRDASVSVFAKDNPTTTINESDIQLQTGNTDMYGIYSFSLPAGEYIVSVNKNGYLPSTKQGSYSVTLKQTTTANIVLFTAQDLLNFNCSLSKYQPYCKNGSLDCNSSALSGYIYMQPNGSCVLGKIGYLDVTLKDFNSNALVKANISVYIKTGNTYSLKETKTDVNHALFYISDITPHQIRVSGTEVKGYIQPVPVDVNGVDQNKVILLEYSTELNSGDINVNVKQNDFPIHNAAVYLFYGSGEYNDQLVSPEPLFTDENGNVKFSKKRAGIKYYAYAFSSITNSQGLSETKMLDANHSIYLPVDLESIPRVLNLTVTNTTAYTIKFYNFVDGDEVTDFIVSDTVTTDKNIDYIFTGDNASVYAVIQAPGFLTYATDEIVLPSTGTVYKSVTLSPTVSCPNTNIEFLGMFDETGTIPVSNIDFMNWDLSKTYKLKFKLVSCEGQKSLEYAHVRVGKNVLGNDDPLFMSSVSTSFELNSSNLDTGNRYHGELNDWNHTYFAENYDDDTEHSGQKWVQISFKDQNYGSYEFSVDIEFDPQLQDLNKYVVYYRSLIKSGDTYKFSPTPSYFHPETWTTVPNGYFYAPTTEKKISFVSDYGISYKLTGMDGASVSKNGDSYPLLINKDYNLTLNYIYVKEQSISNGTFKASSQNTNNNLKYKSYIFKDNLHTFTGTINDNNYTISNLNAQMLYSINSMSIIRPVDFFSSSGNKSINFNILNNPSSFSIPVLAYTVGDYIILIKTTDPSGDNDIFAGNNNITFEIKSAEGHPINNINVKYTYSGLGFMIPLGFTGIDTPGKLQSTISFGPELINSDINFIFTFPSESGYSNDENIITKKVSPGYKFSPTDLNYDIYVIDVNGVQKSFNNLQAYQINYFGGDINVNNITVGSNDADVNLQKTILKLKQENNISSFPFSLTSSKLIKTPIVLNTISGSTTTPIKVYFENEFNQGLSYYGVPMISIEDINADVNITFLKFTRDINAPTQGFYIDSNSVPHLEFIKDTITSMDLNYSLKNNSDKNLIIKNITIRQDSPQLKLQNPQGYLSYYFTNKDFNKGNTINLQFLGNQLFILDLSAPTGSGKLYLDFNFVVTDTNKSFVYTEVFDINVYTKSQVYSKTLLSSADTLVCYDRPSNNSLCDGNLQISYKFTNYTKSYDINLLNLQELTGFTSSKFNLIPESLNILIPKNSSKTIYLDINASGLAQADVLSPHSFKFSFDINVLDKKLDTITWGPYNISIIKTISEPEHILNTQDLSGKFCLGVGGQIINNHVFILSNCASQSSGAQCKTGEDAVIPQIIYKWNDLIDCVQNVPDYNDDNKNYCDSVQMLSNIFERLKNTNDWNQETNQYTEFYMYLVADSVSDDLLKDFMYTSNEFMKLPSIDVMIKNCSFYNNSEVGTNFKIARDSNKPGLYKVIIKTNDDWGLSHSSSCSYVDINISFVSPLPANKNNLFYYLPIDGDVGCSSSGVCNRDGYGSLVNYGGDNMYIPLFTESGGNQPTFLRNISGSNTPIIVNAINNASFDIKWKLKNTLESQGQLLKISLLPGTGGKMAMDLIYTPSYPVPLYVLARNIHDHNLNYVLIDMQNNSTSIKTDLPSPFITWYDYNDSNKTIIDEAVNQGGYKYHSANVASKYVVAFPNRINNALLKTMIYLPVTPQSEYNDYKLFTSDLSNVELLNDENTIFFVLNQQGSNYIKVKDASMSSIINTAPINFTIMQLFEFVREGKACIETNMTTTYIKWIDENVGFTQSQTENIINDSNIAILGQPTPLSINVQAISQIENQGNS